MKLAESRLPNYL